MGLTSKERLTIGYYDGHAEEWIRERGGFETLSYWQQEIERFHSLLTKGRVVEIGPGAGREAELLISLGYDYTGIEPSIKLLKKAQYRNPKGKFIHKDICSLNLVPNYFDGFWTAASLLHIPKSKIDKALKNISKTVKANGMGFISLKAGVGEEQEKDTKRWFSYYQEGEFDEILTRNKFEIVEKKSRVQSPKTTWLIFFVKNLK